VRQDATGRFVRDGVLTDWYEDGAPMRFLDYADGVPHGTEVRWNPDGSVRSRAEYRHGSRTILPGQS
jgi:antitoxin component YwqK of YwqJK toxin-antitoxin module